LKRIIKLLAIGGLALAGTLAAITTASADAHLESSSPAAGAVLASSPANVALTFVEEIQRTAGTYSLDVTDDMGHSVISGSPTVGDDDMSLSVALKPSLPDGVYTVTWGNTSEDGHSLSEEFTFTVGSGSAPMPAPTMPSPAMPAGHHHDTSAMPADMSNAAVATVGSIVAAVIPQHGSGVDGRVELVAIDGGMHTQIGVYLNGVVDGSAHMAHLHVGSTCAEGARTADLENVMAMGTDHGSSVTEVARPFASIADGNHVILIHAGGDDSSAAHAAVVACALIPAQPAARNMSMPTALPGTGTGSGGGAASAWLLLGAIALTGAAIASGATVVSSVRRQRAN
jgi:methionine-rich copper-binding protein CopC